MPNYSTLNNFLVKLLKLTRPKHPEWAYSGRKEKTSNWEPHTRGEKPPKLPRHSKDSAPVVKISDWVSLDRQTAKPSLWGISELVTDSQKTSKMAELLDFGHKSSSEYFCRTLAWFTEWQQTSLSPKETFLSNLNFVKAILHVTVEQQKCVKILRENHHFKTNTDLQSLKPKHGHIKPLA